VIDGVIDWANRSEVGLWILSGDHQKGQEIRGNPRLLPHHSEGTRMMG
jgi:hypothetical protein